MITSSRLKLVCVHLISSFIVLYFLINILIVKTRIVKRCNQINWIFFIVASCFTSFSCVLIALSYWKKTCTSFEPSRIFRLSKPYFTSKYLSCYYGSYNCYIVQMVSDGSICHCVGSLLCITVIRSGQIYTPLLYTVESIFLKNFTPLRRVVCNGFDFWNAYLGSCAP